MIKRKLLYIFRWC